MVTMRPDAAILPGVCALAMCPGPIAIHASALSAMEADSSRRDSSGSTQAAARLHFRRPPAMALSSLLDQGHYIKSRSRWDRNVSFSETVLSMLRRKTVMTWVGMPGGNPQQTGLKGTILRD